MWLKNQCKQTVLLNQRDDFHRIRYNALFFNGIQGVNNPKSFTGPQPVSSNKGIPVLKSCSLDQPERIESLNHSS